VVTVAQPRAHRYVLIAGLAIAAGLLALACSSSNPDDPTAFCDAMRDASASGGPIATLEIDDPIVLENALADLDALAAIAPGDIAQEAEAVADIYRDLLTSLASTAPGARDDVLRDFQAALDDTSAAAQTLEAYGRDTCALAFEGPAQPTPTPTPLDIDD
jgi:hypothetical protein